MLEYAKNNPIKTGAIVIGGAIVIYLIAIRPSMGGGTGSTVVVDSNGNGGGSGGLPPELIAMQMQGEMQYNIAVLEAQTSIAGKTLDRDLAYDLASLQANMSIQNNNTTLAAKAMELNLASSLAALQVQMNERQISSDEHLAELSAASNIAIADIMSQTQIAAFNNERLMNNVNQGTQRDAIKEEGKTRRTEAFWGGLSGIVGGIAGAFF